MQDAQTEKTANIPSVEPVAHGVTQDLLKAIQMQMRRLATPSHKYCAVIA